MTSKFVQPYLFFSGNCEEAVEFYRTAIGAEPLMLMRFKESPDPHPPGMLPPGYEDKVMHVSFRVGSTIVMASDGGGCQGHDAGFNGFTLSLTVPDAAEAERVFAALSQAGSVKMPLTKTFWSPLFGMVTDRFGVNWMVTLPI